MFRIIPLRARRATLAALIAAPLLASTLGTPPVAAAFPTPIATSELVEPAGGQSIYDVQVLPNGNIVATDPTFEVDGVPVGAIMLFDGATHALISLATGARIGDAVGGGVIVVVGSSNAVVTSPGFAFSSGAATFVDGDTGVSGEISYRNSLVGSAAHDGDLMDVDVVGGGNYLVEMPGADVAAVDGGAIAWGNGESGVTGVIGFGPFGASSVWYTAVTAARLGQEVDVLANGNAVARVPNWAMEGRAGAGAVALLRGGVAPASRTEITAANAYVGVAGQHLGAWGVVALANGNYVVVDARVGTVTWRSGTDATGATFGDLPIITTVSNTDAAGLSAVPLADGNYVVVAPGADVGGAVDAGAVRWAPGDRPTTAYVTSGITGVRAHDGDGMTVTGLASSGYVVALPSFDDGIYRDRGAVRWATPGAVTTGAVALSNSFVGVTTGDRVGTVVTALSDGSYAVGSPDALGVGASTHLPGDRETSGIVGPQNSLLGAHAGDRTGAAIAPLAGGAYAVASPRWSNGTLAVGAVTWQPAGGRLGIVTAADSLSGGTVGDGDAMELMRLGAGDLVVRWSSWDGPGAADAGAVSYLHADGRGSSGVVSAATALVGATAEDRLGGVLVELDGGVVAMFSADWHAQGSKVGALTFVAPGEWSGVLGTERTLKEIKASYLSVRWSWARTTSGDWVVSAGARGVLVRLDAAHDGGNGGGGNGGGGNGGGAAGSGFVSLTPARLVESRTGPGLGTVDGVSSGIGVRAAGSVTEVQVTGRGGVPAGARAAVLNVSVVDARGPGFVTVFACGADRPNAASATYASGQTISNSAVVALSASGSVCVSTYASIDLVVDVTGAFTSSSSLSALVPARLVESRTGPGLGTVDGVSSGIGVRGAGSVTEVQVTGRGGVPAGAAAAVLNVSVVDARGAGFVTVFPCGSERPNAASATYAAGQTISNSAVVALSASGRVCVYTHAAIDLVVDVTGAFASASSLSGSVPARLAESRTGPGLGTVDGVSSGIGVRAAGSVTEVQVTGRGGVPAGAAAAVVNVSVVDARGPGFVTVFACGADRPNAASATYAAGQTISNTAIVALSASGTVCVYTHAAIDLVVDVTGAIPA